MALTETIGHIDSELLALWRLNCAKTRAVETNPTAFSQQETVDIYMERWRFEERIAKDLNVGEGRDWICSPLDGLVYYKDYD